jgi:hypothetical protein
MKTMLDETLPTIENQRPPGLPRLATPAADNPALRDAMDTLNRLPALDPEHPQTSQIAYQASQKLLRHEPFLAYQGENEWLYWVWSRLGLSLLLPKNRMAARPYPEQAPGRLDPAHRTLALALLGLLLGGFGTLLLAPLAAWRPLGVLLDRSAERPDRIRAAVVIVLAGLLWLVAAGLALLFLLHFTG